MALTYNTFTTDLANMLPVPVTDTGYVTALPNIIDDAEQFLYRKLQLLNTIVRDSSTALTANNRNFTLPTGVGTFVVVEEINVITPVGTTNPDSGKRNQLLPTSKEYLDAVWPNVTGATVPNLFAMITQGTIIVGPWPDSGYQVEVVGTQRPAPLSSSNQTTILTTYLPDLFFAASMVFACGYQQNFSAMADNPASSVSWEAHMNRLLETAETEEMMKKFASQGWSSKEPAPNATPPRT